MRIRGDIILVSQLQYDCLWFVTDCSKYVYVKEKVKHQDEAIIETFE